MGNLTHTELQNEATELFRWTGWRYLHVRASIGKRPGGARGHMTTTNIKGWPDLWCWNVRQPGRWLALEVKVPPDWLSDDQRAVLPELAAAGAEALVLVERPLTSDRFTLPAGVGIVTLPDLPRVLSRPR